MLFDRAGSQNTEAVIDLALKRAGELNVSHIVVASCEGNTIKKILERSRANQQKLSLVCVTHHNGFAQAGENELGPDTRKYLLEQGVQVLTTTHFFAGADRAVRNQFGGVYPAEIMAQTLRIFGQGVKVAVEVAIMALDAGLIPYGKEVIAIGGSSRGADAALVIQPAHSNHFFSTQVKEVICMPRNKKTE
ncbi:MAG: hypothetical protein GXY40_00735 [Syntrophomonadaceae bacterium]|jgi:hypothetical protein|nr:hypothetical protein [Syntrophomonadaceae bacterium]